MTPTTHVQVPFVGGPADGKTYACQLRADGAPSSHIGVPDPQPPHAVHHYELRSGAEGWEYHHEGAVGQAAA